MNILYIGAGFVGACSAGVSADSGDNTLVFDIDKRKIEMLGSRDRDTIEECLPEKGLGDLIVKNKDRISFTYDYSQVEKFLDTSDAVFLCLPTPEIGETGESNLKYYWTGVEELSVALKKRQNGTQEKYIVVINKSTIPIETIDELRKKLEEAGVKNFGVACNPEFLSEGVAVRDALKPDRVVVGAENQKDFDILRKIYQRFYFSPDCLYIETSPREAAAGKLLANFYLFNKLAICFDVIGRVSESFEGIKFEKLREIITTDKRIGSWGFYDSLYAGGSCFIKDSRSLAHQLEVAGSSAEVVNGTYLANQRQLNHFISRAETEANFDWTGKKVAILGLSFKRDTNDIRNSPSIEIVKTLENSGVEVFYLYDPLAAEMFKGEFSESDKYVYVGHEFEAVKEADVVIISTDWPQFRGLADTMINELDKKPLIMDGRRMLQHRYEDLKSAGFSVIAVGSPFIS